MVEALLGFVIDCADIDHDITGFQDSGIARPFEIWVLVSLSQWSERANVAPAST